MVGDRLAAALAAVYAAYWLMMLFVRANRRLSGLLRDRETRLGEARSRMDRMRRDCELAGRTHDTVAGGLSYIAFLAQQRMEDSDLDDEEREAWQRVDQAAQRTLDNVHRVIDVLDGGETPPGSGCLADLLGGRVKAGVARLRTLGFDGTISVDVDGLPGVQVGEAASREASDLVDELFVNIAAHADPDQPYSLDVAAGRGRFRRARSGRGLGLHRRRIQVLGGTLNTSLEDGEWTLYADLPLQDRDGDRAGTDDAMTDGRPSPTADAGAHGPDREDVL